VVLASSSLLPQDFFDLSIQTEEAQATTQATARFATTHHSTVEWVQVQVTHFYGPKTPIDNSSSLIKRDDDHKIVDCCHLHQNSQHSLHSQYGTNTQGGTASLAAATALRATAVSHRPKLALTAAQCSAS
jgi:hypothetical protein